MNRSLSDLKYPTGREIDVFSTRITADPPSAGGLALPAGAACPLQPAVIIIEAIQAVAVILKNCFFTI
jgi:hypothetical protein